MLQPFSRKKVSRRQQVLRAGGLVFTILFLWYVVSWVRAFRLVVIDATYEVVTLGMHSKQYLVKKVQALQNERIATQGVVAENAVLRADNAALRAELGRTDVSGGVIARVTSSVARSLYDTMLIDAGADQGIEVGQRVYAFGGVALGTISEVRAQSATVLLYSAPGRQTGAVLSSRGTQVTLIGRGGGEYEMRLSRDVLVDENAVIAEQSTLSIPIAVVQKIVTDPRDPFQKVFAKIPVTVQRISWVRVF